MSLTQKQKQLMIYVILLGLSILGNCFPYSLYFGLDLTLGSIALFVIAYMFGWIPGIVASVVAGGCTYLLWGHPFGALIQIIEFISVKYLIEKRKWNLLTSDLGFWIILGIPCAAALYFFCLHMNFLSTTVAVLKYAQNGLLNALISSLLVTCLPFHRWFPQLKEVRSISQLTFHLLTSFVILPSFMMIIVEGRAEIANHEKQIEKDLIIQSNAVSKTLEDWYFKNRLPVIRLADAAADNWDNTDPLQRDAAFTIGTFPDFYNLCILDQTGSIFAYHDIFSIQSSIHMGENFGFRPYFKETKRTQLSVISDIFTGVGQKDLPTVAITQPIIKDGNFQGISLGTINPASLKDLLSKSAISPEMILTLVDKQNQVIASNNPDLVTMQIFDWRKYGDIENVRNDLYQWQPRYINNPMKKWTYSVFTTEFPLYGSSSWKVVVQLPLNSYQNEIYLIYSKLFFISLMSTLIALLLSFFIRGVIVKPLMELARQSYALPQKIASKGTVEWTESSISEFRLLINNFREMGNTLQEMYGKLDQLASYDPLTGLPNRHHFQSRLEEWIARAKLQKSSTALIFLDIDRFKLINDTLGHSAGDIFLQQVATRLSASIGSDDFVARLGGDEFVILLNHGVKPKITNQAEAIIDVLSKPFYLDEQELIITPSIGISLFPEDAEDAERLIKHADTAMYFVKESGKNGFQFFKSEMNEKVRRKLELERKLRRALSSEQLEVYYQPKVKAKSEEIVGVEALCRWRDSEEGWISPAEFISLAEEIGLIGELGYWVLKKACTQIKAWQDKGFYIPISVNLSVHQLKQHDLVSYVSQILSKTKLDPSYLELEITENVSLHGVDEILPRLHELKGIGVKISMDDFGTGYSSLSYFSKYPIDTVKIDQSFVRNYENEAPIIDAILDLAHRLGLAVIAEGVETREQKDFLLERGCQFMQGYYFSKPLSCKDFDNLLIGNEQLILPN